MAISSVQMPSSMVDYSTDNSLNPNAGAGDQFSTPPSSDSSSDASASTSVSAAPADAQALSAQMLGSLPDLSSAWSGMAGAS